MFKQILNQTLKANWWMYWVGFKNIMTRILPLLAIVIMNILIIWKLRLIRKKKNSLFFDNSSRTKVDVEPSLPVLETVSNQVIISILTNKWLCFILYVFVQVYLDHGPGLAPQLLQVPGASPTPSRRNRLHLDFYLLPRIYYVEPFKPSLRFTKHFTLKALL